MMADPQLEHLEYEVEAARAKLAEDLSTLRSPNTLSEFTDDLKHEALEAKNALVEKARASMQSVAQAIIDDLKAKAAANPSAALAIGAGLGWRFLRHPPIATALVGAGLISLWRTNSARPPGEQQVDHLSYAKERLKEQSSDLAESVSDFALETAGKIKREAAELTGVAKETVKKTERLAAGIRHSGAGAHEGETAARASAPFDEASLAIQDASGNEHTEDKLLLAAAGLAVAAAVGFAYQRRLNEQMDTDRTG
ncbi:hypothetical protein NKH70_34835 [Mesorhizobium sp. M0991]|uniref:hypothetical protein n=1 Tax=unclassified Mesorhizobium TaxID=325217 RepID=UPI003334E1A9